MAVLVFSLGLLISCKQTKHIAAPAMATHHIEANIKGLGDDALLVYHQHILSPEKTEEAEQDTVFAKNGRFSYSIPGDEPLLVFLMPRKAIFTRAGGKPYWAREKAIVVLIKPGDQLQVEGELKELIMDYTAKGSTFNEQYTQLRKGYLEAASEAVAIELQIDTLEANKGDKELINALFQKRKNLGGEVETARLEFIKNNLDTDLAAFFLTMQPWETFGEYYPTLAPEVQNGLFKTMLDSDLATYEKYKKMQAAELAVKEGTMAPDFVLRSPTGNLALNTVQGEYVVLDFWGSWCAPCIKGFPEMKAYYAKYKDKVEFVGIDCNEPEEAWQKALQKYDLPWAQVIDGTDEETKMSVKYGVQYYPTKFILDKDKKIVAKFIGEDESFYKKLDELMQAK